MVEIEKIHDIDVPVIVQNGCDAVGIDINYPRHNRLKYVHVGLCCVRAAEDILIGYDFDRDGWVIHQQKHTQLEGGCCETLDGWHEVAFVQAWQLEAP